MNPILLDLGYVQIKWYSLLLILAFIIGYFIALKIAKEKKIKKTIIESYFVYIILGAIIGARLFEVILYNPTYYLSNPIKVFYIWGGGITSHGAIAGMIISTLIFSKIHKIKFYTLADITVVPCALGATLVRIGNFINEELVGKTTSMPWGVNFKNYGGLRHPVQLYEAFTNFVLFIFLYSKRKLKDGILFWSFLLIYSVFRLTIEFFKYFPEHYGLLDILGLNTAQWLSIIIIIISTIFLIKIKFHAK